MLSKMGLSPRQVDLNVMTINMKNGEKADKLREEVANLIAISNQEDSPCRPDIVFAQEISAPKTDRWMLETNDYIYSDEFVTSYEAGLMWKDNFEKMDYSINKQEYMDVIPEEPYRTWIPVRLCALILKHKKYKYKILAVSWHGPHKLAIDEAGEKNCEVDTVKKNCFEFLQKYAEKMMKDLRKHHGVNFLIIGGDFNLDLAQNGIQRRVVEEFDLKSYTMSMRREGKGGKKLIDNFLVYPKRRVNVIQLIPMDFRKLGTTEQQKIKRGWPVIIYPNPCDDDCTQSSECEFSISSRKCNAFQSHHNNYETLECIKCEGAQLNGNETSIHFHRYRTDQIDFSQQLCKDWFWILARFKGSGWLWVLVNGDKDTREISVVFIFKKCEEDYKCYKKLQNRYSFTTEVEEAEKQRGICHLDHDPVLALMKLEII